MRSSDGFFRQKAMYSRSGVASAGTAVSTWFDTPSALMRRLASVLSRTASWSLSDAEIPLIGAYGHVGAEVTHEVEAVGADEAIERSGANSRMRDSERRDPASRRWFISASGAVAPRGPRR